MEKIERPACAKIKAIVKRPDEKYGHVTHISATLENLQKLVGGYIETITIAAGVVIICNEEGKLLNLPRNLRLYGDTVYADTLRGDIVVIGAEDDDFKDLKMDFKTWKSLVDKWEG